MINNFFPVFFIWINQSVVSPIKFLGNVHFSVFFIISKHDFLEISFHSKYEEINLIQSGPSRCSSLLNLFAFRFRGILDAKTGRSGNLSLPS